MENKTNIKMEKIYGKKITEEALSVIEYRVENSLSCIYQNFKRQEIIYLIHEILKLV